MVMDPTIRPLVPVLRSNYWLTIHVLTITLSYGAFMLAMGIANVALYWFYGISKKGESRAISERIALLNQLTYRALMFGTVLLAAGTILGGVWADYSWGRFWGWDPKEVWALIALLSYMAVLHGRFTGWVGKFAFPLWTVICFSTVVMAWYGVNFVLGVGLHSYGFSTGGQAFVFGFLLLQTAFCLWVAYHYQRLKKTAAAEQAG
jgi:ABC-type transport system involved in cytochrome c biogenesis permease subunit